MTKQLYVLIDGAWVEAGGPPGPPGADSTVPGPEGPAGPAGPPGTAYLSAAWNFNQTTTVSPAAGSMRMNATTYAATTTLWVHEQDRDSIDRSVGLSLGVAGDQIIMQSPQGRAVWNITAQADSGAYRTFTVTLSESTGARPNTGAITTLYFASAGSGGGASTLNDLTDVDTTGVVNGNVLSYNTGLAVWVGLPTTVTYSEQFSSNVASNAWDNNPVTYWNTGGTNPAWTVADFGVPVTAARIYALANSSAFPWKLEGSADGTTWTTVVASISVSTTEVTTNFTAATYRYWKMSTPNPWIEIKSFTLYNVVASWVPASSSNFLVLGPTDPIPGGTPVGTVIVRTA